MSIDIFETPFAREDTCVILGLNYEAYERACDLGLLQKSAVNPTRPSSEYTFHNFFDLLLFALLPKIVRWLNNFTFEDIFELLDMTSSALTDQDVRLPLNCPDVSTAGLTFLEIDILTQIARTWNLIAIRATKCLGEDTELFSIDFENAVSSVRTSIQHRLFSDSSKLCSMVYPT